MRIRLCNLTGFLVVTLISVGINASVLGFAAGKKTVKNSEGTFVYVYGNRNEIVKTIPNKLVIKFKDGLNLGKQLSSKGITSVDNLLTSYNIIELEQVIKGKQKLTTVKSNIQIENIYYASFVGEQSAISVAKTMSKNSLVEYAEPLYIHHPYDAPNDPQFSQQKYLDVIKAQQAWDVVKGELGNAVIAIVDGGTDLAHPDLADNLWINLDEIPNNGIDDDDNGFVDDVHGWNFANNSNDPSGLPNTPENANHGTHTAGIACAVTNNGAGVAGVSWNASLMPINISSPTEDGLFMFGTQGILYAAQNGADVISISWGGSAFSRFEQDVINFATKRGVAIVAAAGNNNTSLLGFPASYENVTTVIATYNNDFKADFSNFGAKVDIAAPGVNIFNTLGNENYGVLSGTSMSTPLVAGVVGLVKSQHPNWRGIQASEQVRVTSDNIDRISRSNRAFSNQLGRGRVNAFRAVTETSPSIRITNVQFKDSNGDGVIVPGETVDVFLSLKNFLAPASNVNLVLGDDNSYVYLTNANANLPSINTMDRVSLTTPFTFNVLSSAPSGQLINFTLEISSGNYEDKDRFTLMIQPNFGTASINNIDVTVTNIGRLGFPDLANSGNGIGFKFLNGPNLLFEGALVTATSVNEISNAARGSDSSFDKDFTVARGGELQVVTPGAISDQESIGIFKDTQSDNPMNIRITQKTFAMNESPNDDFILFRYTVENQGSSALTNFHIGIFNDWDIDVRNYSTNVAAYDALRRIGYAFDTGNGPDTHVGLSVLNEGGVSFRAIYNDENHPENSSWGVYDGFTDSEKWQALSGGLEFTRAGPADISCLIATGPFTIEPNSSIQLGFALLAGTDLIDLQANADAAKILWDELFADEVDEMKPKIPTEFSLKQNYPNPFNPTTSIQYELSKLSNVEMTIYNMLGQIIRTLVKERQSAGFYSMQWDGKNDAGEQVASGVYLYRIKAGDFTQTRKMLLLR